MAAPEVDEPHRVHLEELLRHQDGVVNRRQLLAVGLDDHDIARFVRRRRLTRLHRGVFIDHTGVPTWEQRAWGATLTLEPAALAGPSALVAFGLRPADDSPVHVVVDHSRRVSVPRGVRVQRSRAFETLLHPSRVPQTVRLEHAVLQAASQGPDESAAVAVLADACRTRRTTPTRLHAALQHHPRLPGRALLAEVLDDVASGAHSVLEHRYLRRVERRHGLPRGNRQERQQLDTGLTYRDVEYLGGLVVVELDGRLGHEWAQDRWRDFDRDLAAAVQGSTSLRLGWRQVFDECRTASRVGAVLASRGWRGELRACGPGCSVATNWGGLRAAGA